MRLQLPDTTDPATLAGLGPRLSTATVTQLRQLVCPASAAAFMLALATDADAACMNISDFRADST